MGNMNYSSIVRILLDKQANPNLESLTGYTVLHTHGYAYTFGALSNVYRESLRTILNVRAHIDHCDHFGLSPLGMVALFSGDLAIARCFLDNRADVNLRIVPTTMRVKSICNICRILLRLGLGSAEVFYLGGIPNGTCLHVAAARGHFDMCEMLTNAMADISIQGQSGHTAMDLARELGFDDDMIVKLRRRCE